MFYLMRDNVTPNCLNNMRIKYAHDYDVLIITDELEKEWSVWGSLIEQVENLKNEAEKVNGWCDDIKTLLDSIGELALEGSEGKNKDERKTSYEAIEREIKRVVKIVETIEAITNVEND